MAISYRKKVTLHCADPKLSMESVLVTVTATMTHGSALVAAGTEATKADVADVVGFIDDQQFGEFKPAVGTTALVNVVKRNAIVNSDALVYSDDQNGLSALEVAALAAAVEGKNLLIQSAVTDFSRLV